MEKEVKFIGFIRKGGGFIKGGRISSKHLLPFVDKKAEITIRILPEDQIIKGDKKK